MDKSETIAKLYALRAGISYLSDKRKETLGEEYKINAFKQAIDADKEISDDVFNKANYNPNVLPDVNDGSCDCWDEETKKMFVRVREAKRDIRMAESYNKRDQWAESQIKQNNSSEIEKNKTLIEKDKKKIKAFKTIEIIFACISVVAVILAFVLSKWIILNAAVFGAVIIGVAALTVGSCKSRIYYCNKTIDEKEQTLRAYEETDKQINGKVDSAEKVLEQTVSEITALTESVNKKKKAIVRQTKPFYNAMKDMYSEILFEDDWKYLDLIIYDIETGRNDTIRATLQKIDMFRQSNSIGSLVYQAADNVKNLIREMKPEVKEEVFRACEEICGKEQIDQNVQLKNLNAEDSWENVTDVKSVTAKDLMTELTKNIKYGVLEMIVDVQDLKENY